MTTIELYWFWISNDEIPKDIDIVGICSIEKVETIIEKLEDFLRIKFDDIIPVYAEFRDYDKEFNRSIVSFFIYDIDVKSEELSKIIEHYAENPAVNTEEIEKLRDEIEKNIGATDEKK